MDNNLTFPHVSPANLSLLLKKEIEKIEFYSSYDVMTGVRIAATLGSFFSIMVVLVVYKSKCKSRTASDEKLEAAVAFQLAAGLGRIQPEPPPPPIQTQPRRHRRLLCLTSHPEYWEEECGQGVEWLTVPSRAGRRLSSLTNSSFYLDRRDSLLDMPCLSAPPPYHREPHYFETIDIQVTRPTPEMSRTVSRASLEGIGRLAVPRAPLASAGSSAFSARSASDSVFLDDELIDTEDEVDGFTTDSDPETPESPPGVTLLSPELSPPTLVPDSTSPCSPMEEWQARWSPSHSAAIFTVCSGVARSASAGHLVPQPQTKPVTKSLAQLCWSRETLF